MGALLPNDNDIEVIDALNKVFTGPVLTRLRRHIQNNQDEVFDGGRALHLYSYRLKIWPSSGNRPKGRWFVFLRDLVGPANKQKILKGIRDAVNDTTCVGIRFWARMDPGVPSGYDVEVVTERGDATGKHWVTITLLCDHEINAGVAGDPATPPADMGEKGPPQPLVTRSKKARVAKKPAKKKAAKSSKKSRKIAKKTR